MATNGPKTGAPKPAAPKPAARATKPAAPKAEAAVTEVEKPAPKPKPETIVPAPAVEPVPVAEIASQDEIESHEAVKTIEAVAAPVVEAAAEVAPMPAAALKAAAEPVMKETRIMETVETTTAKAQAFFADFNDRTKAAVEKSTKMVEEANEFAKGNLEAVVESGRIAAKGLESFGQDAAEYGRKQFEHATSVMKTLATVKSPTEFFKLQSDFMRGAFDAYVAEASKNTEAMLKLAGDAAQPLSNRIAVAAEKAKTTV